MFKTTALCILASSLVFLSSCEEDKENTSPPVDYNSQGVYIVNEGGFMAGNASISYLDIDAFTVTNDIFSEANGIPLGDVAQSMTISGGKGYIVVNNSQKVEVVDLTDFTSVATISGFSGPRFMQVWNTKGFVTDWFSNEVKVIDLNSNAITNTIAAGSGPEQLCVSNDKLYVVNVGGFDSDSTVTVIDPAAENVLATIPVGLNPNSVTSDLNGAIWVLCGGSLGPDFTPSTADDIAGSLWKINPASLTATEAFTFPQNIHPVKMQRDGAGRYMYFLRGSSNYTGIISRFDAVPASVAIVNVVNKNFYGLGVDPGSGHLYGGTAPGFTQNGWIYRYEGGGAFVDSAEAGIAPGYFTFKP